MRARGGKEMYTGPLIDNTGQGHEFQQTSQISILASDFSYTTRDMGRLPVRDGAFGDVPFRRTVTTIFQISSVFGSVCRILTCDSRSSLRLQRIN